VAQPAPEPEAAAAAAVPGHDAEPGAPVRKYSAREIIDGKRVMREILADAMVPYLDTGKTSPMAQAAKCMQSAIEDEPGMKEVCDELTEAHTQVTKLGDKMKKIDIVGTTVDNYDEKRAELDALLLAFDNAWQMLETQIENWATKLSDRKKDFFTVHFPYHVFAFNISPRVFLTSFWLYRLAVLLEKW
jgi:hypothetical protein